MSEYKPAFGDTRLAQNRAGFWVIRWTVPKEHSTKGRSYSAEISTGTKDRRDAEQFRIDWFDTNALIDKSQSSTTIGGLIRSYVTNYCEPNKVGRSQTDSLKPVERHLGAKDVAQFTSMDSVAYRTARLKEGVKEGTIRRELGALRRGISWANTKELWPVELRLPVIELPPDSKPRTNYIPGKREAEAYDLAAMDFAAMGEVPDMKSHHYERERAALFTMLALDTAARAGAIEGLSLDRIDLVNRLIDYRDL